VACSALSSEEQAAAEAILEDHADKCAQVTAYAQKQARTAAELAAYIRAKCGLPAGSAVPAAAGADVLDKLIKIEQQNVKIEQQNAELKAAVLSHKRCAIQLSDIGSDGWHDMLAASGFSVDASTAWPDALSARLLETAGEDPPAFQWEDRNEPDQKDRYLPYLRTHLQMEQRQGDAALITPDNERSFLSVSDKRLQFDIRGTTDVAVVHQGYISARLEEQGILAVIELKKGCTKKDTRQTIGQLIAADLISTFSPLAVLTDLRDEWHFYWLEGRTIKHLRPPAGTQGRRLAFSFLRLALAPGFVAGEQLAAANAAVAALPVSVGKRRKLSPVKEDRPRRESGPEDSAEWDSESDDDEDDRKQLLFRQVRQMIRHTPWLQEVCRQPFCIPMSAEARNMFG